KDVILLNCPSVTDKGLIALTDISSIEFLQLEGTSITDTALEVLAEKLKLTAINVSNCSRVTIKGLLALVGSDRLEGIDFSVNDMSQSDVLELISRFKNVKDCFIIDPLGKMDLDVIKHASARKQ